MKNNFLTLSAVTAINYLSRKTGWGATFAGVATGVAAASGTTKDGFVYSFAGASYTITGYTGTALVIVIPVVINGLPVTAIGASAFSGQSGLTAVTISNGITSIGNLAFYNCSGLTSVTIPDSVTSIGNGAFSGKSGLTAVPISSGVTSIGNLAFYNCSGLTSVTIPKSVTSIGDGAFQLCSSLTSVTISSGVTSIGGWVFSHCSALTSFTVPASVISIGQGPLTACSKLHSLIVDAANPAYVSVGNVLFNKTQTELIQAAVAAISGVYIIPGTVKSINADAFSGCTALTGVSMPGSVTNIGPFAFYNCRGLKNMAVY